MAEVTESVKQFVASVNAGEETGPNPMSTLEDFEYLIYNLSHLQMINHFKVLDPGFDEVRFKLFNFEGKIDRRPLMRSGYALDQIHISWKREGLWVNVPRSTQDYSRFRTSPPKVRQCLQDLRDGMTTNEALYDDEGIHILNCPHGFDYVLTELEPERLMNHVVMSDKSPYVVTEILGLKVDTTPLDEPSREGALNRAIHEWKTGNLKVMFLQTRADIRRES